MLDASGRVIAYHAYHESTSRHHDVTYIINSLSTRLLNIKKKKLNSKRSKLKVEWDKLNIYCYNCEV